MNYEYDTEKRALLKTYVERLAAAHQSLQDIHVEMGQIRLDARADGFNMEALQQLAVIVSKSPHDSGVGLLNDMIEYAHMAGIELHTVGITEGASSDDHHAGRDPKESIISMHEFVQVPATGRLAIVSQLVLGLSVSWALIWLLH